MNLDQPPPSRGDILVVDDTPTHLTLLTQLLSDQGYLVRVAPSGKLALKSVQVNAPDLILLDIKMPEMDGYQVCKQLKEMEVTRDIPLIFISSLDEVLDKIKAFTAGGVDYITKPFEPIEVLARIENQLRLRQLQLQMQKQNARLQLLLTATQAINNAADVDSALEGILAKVCQTIGWDCGEAWIPNGEGTALQCSRGWYASNASLSEFCQQSETLTFAPNVGLPGRVWSSKKPEWIEDISEGDERIYLRGKIDTAIGLKAALGVPIISDEQVLAVLVFFQKNRMKSDRQSIELVKAVALQLGSLIQYKKAEAALKQANLELERLATLDGLTQVANRRRFDTYLSQEWKRLARDQQPLSLVLCDVDYFKRYNDCYGHQCGDDCLKQVAKAMSRAVKRPADLVARYGGEEFAVILPNTDTEGAVIVAQEIRAEIQQLKIPHADSEVNPYVTLSLGISSIIPWLDLSPENLIAAADVALYQAKKQGRDRAVISSVSIPTQKPISEN
jgi:two-component system, cell cycle response regulator